MIHSHCSLQVPQNVNSSESHLPLHCKTFWDATGSHKAFWLSSCYCAMWHNTVRLCVFGDSPPACLFCWQSSSLLPGSANKDGQVPWLSHKADQHSIQAAHVAGAYPQPTTEELGFKEKPTGTAPETANEPSRHTCTLGKLSGSLQASPNAQKISQQKHILLLGNSADWAQEHLSSQCLAVSCPPATGPANPSPRFSSPCPVQWWGACKELWGPEVLPPAICAVRSAFLTLRTQFQFSWIWDTELQFGSVLPNWSLEVPPTCDVSVQEGRHCCRNEDADLVVIRDKLYDLIYVLRGERGASRCHVSCPSPSRAIWGREDNTEMSPWFCFHHPEWLWQEGHPVN